MLHFQRHPPAPRWPPLYREQVGQSLVMLTLFLFVLIGMSVLLIDSGRWYVQRHNLQGAADASALAGAQQLPASIGDANLQARKYATAQLLQDRPTIDSVVVSNSSVKVTLSTQGDTFFGNALTEYSPVITVDATAMALSPLGMRQMLPFAYLAGTYTLGSQYPVKTRDSAFGNQGAVRPPSGSSCTASSGANDYRDIILTSDNGGVDACAVPVGETITTETGNIAGPTLQGFETRIGTNTQSIDDVFEYDSAIDRWRVLDPMSPRVGITVVITGTDGVPAWPTGTAPMTVVSYVLCYIGKIDQPPLFPATTDNGDTVWIAPLATILPSEFEATLGPAKVGSDAPVTWRLTE